MKPRIGFVGLGTMGKPMARNLIRAGYDTAVYGRRLEPLGELKQLGAQCVASPRALAAGSDIVIVMVRDDEQVEQVVRGANGLLEGARPGTTIVICSTVSPALCQSLAAAAASRGIGLVDAPVSGASVGAEAGTLTFMVGGSEGQYDGLKPVLEAMGRNTFYFGQVGCGQVAKLSNNIILLDHFFAAIEGVALATRAGIEANSILDMVRVSTGNSWVVEHWDLVTRMLEQRRAGGNAFELIYKDARLGLEHAETLGMQLPLAATCLEHEIVDFPPKG